MEHARRRASLDWKGWAGIIVPGIITVFAEMGAFDGPRAAWKAAGGWSLVLGVIVWLVAKTAPIAWPVAVGFVAYRAARTRFDLNLAQMRQELDSRLAKFDQHNLQTRTDVAQDIEKIRLSFERRTGEAAHALNEALKTTTATLEAKADRIDAKSDVALARLQKLEARHETLRSATSPLESFARLKTMLDVAREHGDSGLFVAQPQDEDALDLGKRLGLLVVVGRTGEQQHWRAKTDRG